MTQQPKLKSPHVWVVEMFMDESRTPQWESTVGAALTQEEGRAAVRDWRHRNPSDKFRLRKYVRADND